MIKMVLWLEIIMQNKKILIFGDSFVKIFGACQNQDIHVVKFKGATIKGLTKPKNKNRLEIERLINQNQQNLLGVIFNFGQVDYNFSCYYKLVREEQFQQESIVAAYFQWINGLKVFNKLVMAVYPSPLSSKSICGALLKYMILTRDQIQQHKQKIMLQFQNHAIRHQKWCQLFKSQKQHYKSMKIIDLTNKIIDKHYQVKKQYRDINEFNIHLLWKKLIMDLKSKFEKYFELNIDLKKLDEEEKKYQEEKKGRMKKNYTRYDF